ncbi:MAG: gliding motility-associated C-terminal domain-containing protein [Bacteroidales bacterium]|nr:gliding motility-associated C-terminal domain-containing protein [Candidatus Colimorpha onthohippi]
MNSRNLYIMKFGKNRKWAFLTLFFLFSSVVQAQWVPTIITTFDPVSPRQGVEGTFRTSVVDTACVTYSCLGKPYSNPNNDGGVKVIDDEITETIYKNGKYYDSVITLRLYLRTNSRVEDVEVACDSFEWVGDTVLYSSTTSTIVKMVGKNAMQCDSIRTLNLTIVESSNKLIEESKCDEYYWPLSDSTYTESTETKIVTGTDGVCKKYSTLNLTIRHKSRSEGYDRGCDRYYWDWNDSVYTVSTTDSVVHSEANAENCDSLRVLHLDIFSTDTIRDNVDTCVDEYYVWSYNGQKYSGSAHDTLSLMNRNMCDSSMILNLRLRNNTSSTITKTVPERFLPFDFFDTTFHGEVTNCRIDSLNAAGCDSVVSFTLHVSWNVTGYTDSNVCDNEVPFVWYEYSFEDAFPADREDTTLRHVIIGGASTGADSTVALTLHIHPSYNNTIDTGICKPSQYTFNETTYKNAGTYEDEDRKKTKVYDCDSITHLKLRISSSTMSTVYDTIVETSLPYNYNGKICRDLSGFSNTAVKIKNAAGCDSLIQYNLKVIPNIRVTVDSSICENSIPFTWNGKVFSEQGEQTQTLFSTVSYHDTVADSIVLMRLKIKQNTYSVKDTTVVENGLGFTFHGHRFEDSISHTKVIIANANNCDSIIDYTVNVRWNQQFPVDTFICENLFPFTWRGVEFQQKGTLYDRHTASGGEDSVLVLRMHTYPAYDYVIDSAVCKGTVVRFAAHDFDTSVFWSDSLHTASYSCDSVVRLRLVVDTPRFDTIEQSVVENQLPYTFLSRTFRLSDFMLGDTVVEDVVGSRAAKPYCDSNVHYTLVLHPNVRATADREICYSQLPYVWNNVRFVADSLRQDPESSFATQAGRIDTIVLLHTAAGADSLLTMRLTVHPEYAQYDTLNSCLASKDIPLVWRHKSIMPPEGSLPKDYVGDSVSMYGCDSIMRLNLTPRANTEGVVLESVVENSLPYNYHGYIFEDDIVDSLIHIQNIYGCDSAVTYSLRIRRNVFADAFDTICYSQLPFVWNGKTFYAASLPSESFRSGDIAQQVKLIASTDADSTLTMHVHVNPTFDTVFYDTICADQTFHFNDTTFQFSSPTTDKTFRYDDTLRSYLGCDSVSSILLRIYRLYNDEYYDTAYYSTQVDKAAMYGIYSPVNPYVFGPYDCFEIGDYFYGTKSIHHCDSLTTMHLWVNQVTFFDTLVCNNHVPFEWHTNSYRQTMVDTVVLEGSRGADSLLVLDITILDTSAIYDHHEVCDVYTWDNGLTYTVSTTKPYRMFTNSVGCDSVVHLDLVVYYSVETGDHLIKCNSHTWVDGHTYTSTIYGPQKLFKTIHGCDSLVTLDLHVPYSTYHEYSDSVCLGHRYNFRGRWLTRAGTYFDSLYTIEGCDSITVLHLTELPTPLIEIMSTKYCADSTYELTVSTDVDYFKWSSVPVDSSLLNQEFNSRIRVKPSQPTTYYMYADYVESPRCPASSSISFMPLSLPKAVIRTSPEYLSYDNLWVEAYDIGEQYEVRNWYINDFMQNGEHNSVYRYLANESLDSVKVMLEVDNGLCRDSAYSVIPMRKPTLYLPNAFTPYLSTNNVFMAKGVGILEFEMYIYNRSGQLVFKTRDINQGWDGKHNDVFCAQGSYIYTIRYRDIAKPDSYQEVTGTIMLLR